MLVMMVLMIMLLAGIIKIGLRLAWGTTKFLFGLGGVVLGLPAVVCAGSVLWGLQPHVAADCNNRSAVWQGIQEGLVREQS